MKEFEVETTAHGRVNLIGEHTDYNGGFVLPTCIPQKTTVRVSRRDDKQVVACSENFGSSTSATRYVLGDERAEHVWSDYVQGVTAILGRSGYKISGFECWIRSSVPMGSGLSSSAALEISLLKALNELFALDISGVEMAKLGQRVENEFVGARVGIMDQLVCSLGQLGEALFVDTRDLSTERLPLPLNEVELLVVNSGVVHSNAHGGYNQRRSECEQACAALGIGELRDLDESDLGRLSTLPLVVARRARHVVTENARVLSAVKALKARRFDELGALFLESHRSMKEDYEVSVPEIDLLVELCMAQSGVYGARLTGGGFGGSIVALTRKGAAQGVGAIVADTYKHRTGRSATILVPEMSRSDTNKTSLDSSSTL